MLTLPLEYMSEVSRLCGVELDRPHFLNCTGLLLLSDLILSALLCNDLDLLLGVPDEPRTVWYSEPMVHDSLGVVGMDIGTGM